MSDCDGCHRPCGFPNSDWYPLGVIRFCRPQMLWLIECDGVYQDSRSSGYTRIDPTIKSQPRQTAPFEKSSQITAEVEARLAKCGIEGKLLQEEVQNGKQLDDFMRCRDCGLPYCPSLQVLNYISGWRRRRQSFKDWRHKSRPKNKNR